MAHVDSNMSFQAITRAYIRYNRPNSQAELGWFHQQPTVRSAIKHAALAINSQGKRYRHQCRLRKATLENARRVLLANSRHIAQSRNFDGLFALLHGLLSSIKGIGELYVYDTSLRIGAKLGLLPTKVYLHAGTRLGAKALNLDGTANALEVSKLPSEFQQLEPHEIEDILCIFKAKLKAVSAKHAADRITKCSWCR